jgi:hypothetical protein
MSYMHCYPHNAYCSDDNVAAEARGLCLGTPRTRAGLEQALTRVVGVLADRSPAARVVV